MNRWQLHLAVKALKAGGVIAYPTESIYGLGCDASNLHAVSQILKIKQRSYKKGLILLVSHIEQAEHLIQPLTSKQLNLINQPSERATTWLLNKKANVSELLSGVHPKLAIRVTQNRVAKSLCKEFNAPIVSTSCNLSGKPTCTIDFILRNKFNKKIDCLVSGNCGGQGASQVVDLESGKLIRE